ncbi:MAG: helix-turn-helix domain-containing protein, partial [Draconibacterium sp.]|nr:helix-turn-helix domain-containing protein [Draconibacterium sp.]
MEKLGDLLKEARQLKGLTQEELADRTNINLRTIQRIENGDNK